MKCSNCGGNMEGNGYSKVLHCEFAEEETYEDHEPDAKPVVCALNELSGMNNDQMSELVRQTISEGKDVGLIYNGGICILNRNNAGVSILRFETIKIDNNFWTRDDNGLWIEDKCEYLKRFCRD